MKNLLLIVCAVIIGSVVIKAKSIVSDRWVYIPTADGGRERVNLDEIEAQSNIQPFFNADNDVTFELYTMKNPYKAQMISPQNITTINDSNLNPKHPTRVVIHGWQERGAMRKEFLDGYFGKAKLEVNLIIVNWESSSQTINYIAASNRVKVIGAHTASLIDFLVQNNKVQLDDVHVIGFSLGAHVAGHTGKNVKSGTLPKITGLDPAAPLFSIDKPHERLDKTDAKYVEIIHTNGAFLGFYALIGTVSFFPNGGAVQSGCSWDLTGTCSHLRAYAYFTESLYSNVSFYGYPCKTFEDMKKAKCSGVGIRMGGEPGNYAAAANIYYLTTNSKPIFARGGSRDM